MTARPNPAQRERMRRRRLYSSPAACPITVVVGPPAGGKSTHVACHAGPAEAVVDLDALALALAPPDTHHHDYPDHLRRAAIAARRAAIDLLVTQPACPRLWIIHAHPSPSDVAQYRRWRADFVIVDPGERVVRSRARFQRPRWTMAAVDRWYRTPPILPSPIVVGDRDATIDF